MNFPIGLQLYSVRDDLEKDFEGTLRKVKALGYDTVEFAGLFGHSAEVEVHKLLIDFALHISIVFSGFYSILHLVYSHGHRLGRALVLPVLIRSRSICSGRGS